MKDKHVAARIKQCLAIAECSPCPRRKFGALLVDPARNVLLMDGYNGGPRGGGSICGGHYCRRDGIDPGDLKVVVHPSEPLGSGAACQYTLEHETPLGKRTHATSIDDALLAGKRLQVLTENPPIPSGTKYEVGCHHAEMNVITNAAASGVRTTGAWLYVTGEPCILCAKLIHHAGIVKVVCVRGGFVGGDAGPAYLREHGVEVEYVAGPADPRTR